VENLAGQVWPKLANKVGQGVENKLGHIPPKVEN